MFSSGRRPALRSSWLLMALILLAAAGYAAYAITRHGRLNSSAYDLAIQAQVLWNSAQGRWFASSLEVYTYLGDHIQPLQLLFVPLIALGGDVPALLAAQALSLCLGAWPLFHLAQRRLGGPGWAWLLAAAYLAYPALGFINRFDFHPEVVVMPLLLAALERLEAGRLRAASVWAGLALLGKEEIGLTVAALGVGLLWQPGRRRWGLVWLAAGLVWSYLALFILIPHFRDAPSDTLARYAWLGATPGEMVMTLLTRPGPVVATLAGDPLRRAYLFKLLLPLGGLALGAPRLLWGALPALAYNLLADSPSQHSIYFQYNAPLIPVLWAATAVGLGRAQRALGQWAWLAGVWLVAGTMAAWALDNPLTTPIDTPHYPVYALTPQGDVAAFRQAQMRVPAGASLATTMAYAPHFTQRPALDLFYHKGRRGAAVYDYAPLELILLNLADWRWGVNPRLQAAMIETAIGRDGYQAVYLASDVVLLAQATPPNALTGAALERLQALGAAGGQFAPTAPETSDHLIGRWRWAALPAGATPLAVTWEGGVELVGAAGLPQAVPAGAALCPTLYWRTIRPPAAPLTIFLHLTAPDGYVHAQRDGQPVFDFYPLPAWRPGEIVGDLRCLTVPAWLTPGVYELRLGWYDSQTGQRLALPAGDFHLLHSLTVINE